MSLCIRTKTIDSIAPFAIVTSLVMYYAEFQFQFWAGVQSQ